MIAVVIPAKNEEDRITKVLDTCSKLPVDIIIPIVNGSTDHTKENIISHPLNPKIKLLYFSKPLGIDIPRAIGAAYAYSINADVILFLDGDMIGNISSNLLELITSIELKDCDMALTNCYPYINYRNPVADTVLKYREKLNRKLKVFSKLGLASPSHGPHAISRKLLEKVPLYSIAIPPLSLAIAVDKKLQVRVVTSIPHPLLLSSPRDIKHGDKIAQTIIGDCLQAINYLEKKNALENNNRNNYLGYHLLRRFDLLKKYVKDIGYSHMY